MSKKVYKPEELVFVEKFIFNGLIDEVDAGDMNDDSIGIKQVNSITALDGSVHYMESGTSISKFMEENLYYGAICSLQYIISERKIENAELEIANIVSEMYGDIEVKYQHVYSEYTGYLWTNEKFVVGGHDVLDMLKTNRGKYIHMEVDTYDIKRNK